MNPTESPARDEEAARALLADLPRLHDWGRGPEVGGLDVRIGERLIAELGRFEAPRVIETGAGASTLLFCCLGPAALTTIAPDAGLRDRMMAEAERRGIPTGPLTFHTEQSELTLPRLQADGDRCDVALIDGSHSLPSVFVDFCYMNLMMPVGGSMIVDDVHLYSCAQLYLMLRQQEEFEYVALDGKMATFHKVVEHSFVPDWRHQPFVEQNTVVAPPA